MRVFTAWLAAATLVAAASTAQPETCGRGCPGAGAALAHQGGATPAHLSRQHLALGTRCRMGKGTPPVPGSAGKQEMNPLCPGCGRIEGVVACGGFRAPAPAAAARRSLGGAESSFATASPGSVAAGLRAVADPVAARRTGCALRPPQSPLYLLFATLLI